MASLVSCPSCHVPCKLHESECPHCGKTIRGVDGKIALTAAAAILGLTMSACGTTEPSPVPAYGVVEAPPPPTTGEADVAPVPSTAPPSPAPTSTPSATPGPEPEAVPAYGVPVAPGK